MSKPADRIAIAVVLLIAAAAGFVREFSGDFHWHIAVGDYIIDNFRLYTHDVHSVTYAGEPMFISSWLGDAALATGYRAGGPVGVYLLRAIALVALSWCLIADGVRRGTSGAVVSLLVLCVIAQSLFQFYLRPEVFAFALFGLLVWTLGKHKETDDRRYLGVALAVILIWANTHGSIGMGLLALGLYCAERVIREWLKGDGRDQTMFLTMLALPPIAFVVACINPEHINLPLAFRITSELWTKTIGEWLPLTMAGSSVIIKLAVLTIIGTTAAAIAVKRETSYWMAVFVVVMAIFTIKYRRFLTWALLGAVPLLSTNLAIIREHVGKRSNARQWRYGGIAVAGVMALWAMSILFVDRGLHKEVGTGIDERAAFLPESGCKFIRDQKAPGPIFNSYELGSYLMHCLGRDYPVFIDQRAWSVYPDPFYRRYREASVNKPIFDGLIAEFPVTWAMVRYDPFAALLAGDAKNWALVYFDDKVLVYARTDAASAAMAIDEHRFRLLEPSRLVALTELPPRFHAAADDELVRVIRNCHDCYRTHLAKAALAIAKRDDVLFERERTELLKGRETAEVAFLSGRHAVMRGAHYGAIQLFVRFRELGGDRLLSYIYQARSTAAVGDLNTALRLLREAGKDPRTLAITDRERRELVKRYPPTTKKPKN